MSKPLQNPKQKSSRIEEGERACAMRLRIYPSRGQVGRVGQWLHCAKRFRNEAVEFCSTRRRARGKWLFEHPALARDWIPEELSGSDVMVCSKWLTSRLEAARKEVVLQTGLVCNKKNMVAVVASAFASLTRGEREELVDGWLLTVQRTVFDQVLQDLAKTTNKAIKDRGLAKKAGSKTKTKKLAGFPQFRKWNYPGSIRLQVSAAKNKEFRAHWAAGELFVPGLGQLKFRDSGYVLPATPPALITVSRDAAGQFHVSFLCVEKEYQQIQGAPDYRSQPLPVDEETGLPVVRAIDLSLKTLAVDDQGESLGRKRHLKRFASRLRRSNKSLSRKQKGSHRWRKAKRELGVLHLRVSNCREAELRHQAKTLVDRSAIVCMEDLLLAFMLQNACLAASAQDVAFGRFKQLLIQECRKQGKLFLQCGRFDATTQVCSACDFKNPNLKNNLKITQWLCPACGAQHDRDHNGAINTKLFALQKVVEMLGLSPGSKTSQWTSLSEPENGFGMSNSLSAQMKHLHPDLSTFIARGGLTALLDHHRSSKSRRTEFQLRPGLDGAREARVLPMQPTTARRERAVVG